MITRMQELCRQLKPVLGRKIDRLWRAYLAESDLKGRGDIEQTLELLAAKYLGKTYEADTNPFPPPSRKFCESGDIELGKVHYGGADLYPFCLRKERLREHILLCGRSGAGKTNLAFVLMEGIMRSGLKVLAIDWKRSYRDLAMHHEDLRVYTIGRNVAPFRFNPFIPPPGCEPNLWIKLIVDIIAQAYLGGEGVISLLISGLDHLYRQYGVYEQRPRQWPTVEDLLGWLRSSKLKGRAALWQTSAERILLSLLFGEFGKVLDTQNNREVAALLDYNVVLEMDGLSSANDKVLFSEALTLYLYRYRLSQGPQQKLTNMIILEEAHNLLHKKSAESKESVLETSIRMIREYGIGYVFIDQSASLLSKVAFANSYATVALSQKLRSDVQTIAGAMNLSDVQKESLSTLPVGTAVVRAADEFSQGFLIKVPLSRIKSGQVGDSMVRRRFNSFTGNTSDNQPGLSNSEPITAIPEPDNKEIIDKKDHTEYPHPPVPLISEVSAEETSDIPNKIPVKEFNKEENRFLMDIITHPLSTTVNRYQRLRLSRRKGNAIRQAMESAGIIERVVIATRTGQVVLYQLTEPGRQVCQDQHLEPGPVPRESLEHRWWVYHVRSHYEQQGYEVALEHPVKGNGAIDLLASRPGETIAIEVETGKSDIKANLENMRKGRFDKMIMLATSPAAAAACSRALENAGMSDSAAIILQTWLDIS